MSQSLVIPRQLPADGTQSEDIDRFESRRRLDRVEGDAQALGQARLGSPAQLALGAGGVDRDALHLAGARWRELGLEIAGAAELAEGVDQLQHVGLDPGADVDRAARLGRGRGEHRRDNVAHIYVVAGLLAVAEDGRLLALAQAAAEDRDHAGLAERVLARAVDVAEPQWHAGKSVEALVEGEVALAGELALAVGGLRRQWRVLGERQLLAVALAVDRAPGRAEDDPPHLGRAGGL